MIERRSATRVRAVFDEAIGLLAPFFDARRVWSGVSMDYFAHCMLRERYPELTRDEICIFVTAAKRVYGVKQTRPDTLVT